MADYNIYLHSTDNVGGSSPTTAWNNEGADANSAFTGSQTSAWTSKAQQAIGAVGNPDSLISKGIGAVAKAVPWVAIAYAIIKVGTFVLDTCFDFQALHSGDYSNLRTWNNMTTIVKNSFTPFSMTISGIKAMQSSDIDNTRRRMNREMLGDAEINSWSNRGV